MIAYINGKIIEKTTATIVVDVMGVGYEIFVATIDANKAQVGNNQKFYTHHAVKENTEDLYGFTSLAGKRLFELLITVPGIGPKAALAILSLDEVEHVRNAIAAADVTYLSKATGVGKKSAERITVDLRDKVGLPNYISPTASTQSSSQPGGDEALDALMALGYNLADATAFLAKVPSDLPTSERIKLALKSPDL